MQRFLLALIALLLPAAASADTPSAAFHRFLQLAEQAPAWQRLLGTLNALVPGVTGPPNPSFYLVNHSGQEIEEVYVSPVAARGWGQDRLGDDTIDAGGYVAIRLVADGTCRFDLRVVYDDGHKEERRGLDTCAVDDVVFGEPAHGSGARDPSFRIVNHDDQTIWSVFTRPSGTRSWGHDRLGQDSIDPDANRVIHMPAGRCLWDVRIVFEDRHTSDKLRLNLCGITDLPVQ